MVRRRKALQSSLELMEDQYFRSLSAIESFRRLARTTGDQLVTEECSTLLSHLGQEIQAWAYHGDFAYRHLQEWPVYVDEREESTIAGLVDGIKDRRDDSDHQTPIRPWPLLPGLWPSDDPPPCRSSAEAGREHGLSSVELQ